MPRTGTVSNGLLGIRLDGPATYSPGDVVHGVLSRQYHVVATNARLTISLQGRSKVKITKFTQNRNHYYRSRFSFFDNSATLQTVFDGPLHIEDGRGRSGATLWPFAVTIPSSVDHGVVVRGGSQKESFTPLDENAPLPASFSGGMSGFSGEFDAFVEYFLVAELTVTGQGSTSSHVATQPVIIRAPNPGPPVDDLVPKPRWMDWCASSHRLVPGMHDAKLSFSQKTQQAFGSKKVPNFTCRVQVKMPTILQLENPATVPVLIHAVPDWKRTSEIIRNASQNIKLVSLTMDIVARTEVNAEGTFTVHKDTGKQSTSICAGASLFKFGKEIFLPCRDGEPALDVGELLGLRVGYTGGTGTGWKLSSHSLYPTFVAYNIKHTHHLEWSLRLSLADQKFEMEGQHLVKILPPAEAGQAGVQGAGLDIEPPPPFAARAADSWIRPPPETEPPPPFSDGNSVDK